MKNHLHTYLALEKNGAVQVALDIPANVYLMDDKAYKSYLADKEFKAAGGYVKARTKTIKAPAAGNWHLVIDSKNQAESVNVSLQIVAGQAINEKWEEQQQEKTADKRKTTRENPPEKTRELSDEELAAKKKALVKDLTKMIKKIDMEGLLHLMKQASVIIHNQQVDEMNKKITDYNQTLVQKQKKGSQKKSQQVPVNTVLVDLKENSENSFILILKGVRKVLSRHELREILRICHSPANNAACANRIYQWLKKKRTDILFETGIRQNNHPLLTALRAYLVDRYRVKED